MTEFFVSVVNMSISAGWIVLAVLLLRVLLKKAPKWITVLLWGIVAVRLICPISLESIISLIPSPQTISPEIMLDRSPEINTGIPALNQVVNPMISSSFAPDPATSANPLQILIPLAAVGWIIGMAVLLGYSAVSYFCLKRKIGTAVLLREGIFQSEQVISPFVLGFIKPKIYLPFRMEEQEMEYVVAHEQAHIRRKDHWWKPLGFLILSIHWFNPLIWLGYILLCRDIELACDEKVIKELDTEQKADYSQALLACSVNRRMIAACPLAFGEVGVKKRIKSVLHYKKPAFWLVVVAALAAIAAALCFLTNPRTTLDEELAIFLDMQVAEHNYAEGHTDENFIVTHHKILDVDRTLNGTTVYFWSLYHEYGFKDGKIQLEAGSHIPTVVTAKRTQKHGHYELVEYWTPRDGSDYEKDIKVKFPRHLHEKALDSQRYIEEQTAFCENAAEEYFALQLEQAAKGQGALIEQLRKTHPHFFNIPTDGGLTVYIWQMAKDHYECYLANTFREAISDNSFAYSVGAATIAEMRAILTTYDISREEITLQPVINPLSSYGYRITKAYREKVKKLFWQDLGDGSAIPDLIISCDGKTAEALKGTATWNFEAEDGLMQAICADSDHPLARTKDLLNNAFKVYKGEKTIHLNFTIMPDRLQVNAWQIDEKGKGKAIEAKVQGLQLQPDPEKETCIYEVVADWESAAKYSGTVRYSFCVRMEEEEYALIPMVKIGGKLYMDTGYRNTQTLSLTSGTITSSVKQSQKPTENDQSNFGEGYAYRMGKTEGTVWVQVDKEWLIFATEEVREKIQFGELQYE